MAGWSRGAREGWGSDDNITEEPGRHRCADARRGRRLQ
jgi:hypothetical protein